MVWVLNLAILCKGFIANATVYSSTVSELNISQYQRPGNSPALFVLSDLEPHTGKAMYFISLSEIVPMSNELEAVLQQEWDKQRNGPNQNFRVLPIDPSFKSHCNSHLRITENDSVYLYDFALAKIHSIPISQLELVANESIYADQRKKTFRSDDYQIGFIINKSLLPGLAQYSKVLVAFGRQSPFIHCNLQPIVWSQIRASKIPGRKNTKVPQPIQNLKPGKAYGALPGNYRFYLQDYSEPSSPDQSVARHLMVYALSSKRLVFEQLFQESEGVTLAPLNAGIHDIYGKSHQEQWAGLLFYGEPEVLFGLDWLAFGCPKIYYLNSKKEPLVIQCDNRH